MIKKNVLYVNACVREDSRTNTLAQAELNKLSGNVTELKLEKERIQPLDRKTLTVRRLSKGMSLLKTVVIRMKCSDTQDSLQRRT